MSCPRKNPMEVKSRVNYSYEETNVDVARTIAKAAREAGCEHFIHVSCAAQSPDSPVAWARAKAKGEQAVLEEFPNATIVRPCALFGPEDRLLNWFATVANMPLQVVPLVDDGRAVVQPTYVADVAKVINKIATEPSQYQGKVVELGGPAEYTRRELAEFTFDITKQKAKLIDVPASMAAAAASFVDVLPVPLWVPDDVELDRLDVVCSGGEDVLTFADFGMAPTPIEKVAFSYLHRYREGGHLLLRVTTVSFVALVRKIGLALLYCSCCRGGGGVWRSTPGVLPTGLRNVSGT